MTALMLTPGRKEDKAVVAVTPLKALAVVGIPCGGEKRRGGQLWQSGGVWLALLLVNGALDTVPWFEGSANVVVARTPVTLDNCRAQAE